MRNAFPSVDHVKLGKSIDARNFPAADLPFIRDRHQRSFTLLKARGGDNTLYKNGGGVLQGDGGAPQQFSETHNSAIASWHRKMQCYTAATNYPVLNIEEPQTDTLHAMTTTALADDLGRALWHSMEL